MKNCYENAIDGKVSSIKVLNYFFSGRFQISLASSSDGYEIIISA